MEFFIFNHTPTSVGGGFRVRGTGEARGGVKCRGRCGFWGRGEFKVRDRDGFGVGVDLGLG